MQQVEMGEDETSYASANFRSDEHLEIRLEFPLLKAFFFCKGTKLYEQLFLCVMLNFAEFISLSLHLLFES